MLVSGPGKDLSEEPVNQDANRPRWATETFLGVLPDPSLWSVDASLVGVGDEVAVDDVGQLTLERADCFFAGFAFGDLLVVVVAACSGVAELGHCSDVESVVEFAVASRVEPMPLPFTRGGIDGCGGVV